MILDTHVHISLANQKVLHHKLEIKEYIAESSMIEEVKGILFLNPFDDKFCCPNSQKDSQVHKSVVRNISNKEYIILCGSCKTIHYKGEDVFRDDNIALLKLAIQHNMYALAFLTAPNLSIQNQIDFYEDNFPIFLGYKLHPTITMFPIDKLKIRSKKAVVVHCGNDKFASPKQIIDFAGRYEGNVIISHFARFDKRALKEISLLSNVWIDMSPFTFLFDLLKNNPEQLCDTWEYRGENKSVKHLFFDVAECVGYDKILFASDAPFGKFGKEIAFLEGLDLSTDYMACIKEKNAKVAFKINSQ